MKIDKYYLKGKHEGSFLTKREAECLALKFRGKTSKEISDKLNISSRTVETHINKIKSKLKYNRFSEIEKIIDESGLEAAFRLLVK